MIKNLFLLLFFLSGTVSLLGQTDNWSFDRKNISDGLSNTYITEIYKDSKGFVWIATQNGLNKYNAYEFEVYKNDEKDLNSISSDKVNCVIEDQKGRIWVGTSNGLNEFDRSKGKFIHLKPDSAQKNYPEVITRMVEDSQGILWVGTLHHGFMRFDPEKKTFEAPPLADSIDGRFYDPLVRCMMIDNANNLWVGTNGFGLISYNIETKKVRWYLSHLDERYSSHLNYTFSIHQDPDGDIWAGTYVGGLCKYDPETDNFRFIHNPHNSGAYIKNGAMSIDTDHNGNILVGGNGGGLFLFDKEKEIFFKNYMFNPINENSIADDFIGEIMVDESGIVWLGTENGGISIYDPNRRKFKCYKKRGNTERDLPGNIINTIYESEDGLVWVGTENNGFSSLDRKTGIYKRYSLTNTKENYGNTFVKGIISDRNGGMWIASHMGGLIHVDGEGNTLEQFSPDFQFENPNRLVDNDINTALLDSKGELWLSGFRGLSLKQEGEDFSNFCHNENVLNGYCQEAIHSLYELNSDYILIGYRKSGFEFFNKKTKKYGSAFSMHNSNLSHNTVNDFCLDRKNRLWIATEKGLHQFHFKDSTITAIYKDDGLPDNKLFGILEDNNGNLWISTAFGLCRFNPDEMDFENFYESDGLQSNVFRQGAFFKSKSGELFFGGVGGFNSFFPEEIQSNPNPPKVVFTDFQLFNKSVLPGENADVEVYIESAKRIELTHKESIFSFEFAALNYTLTEENEYAYKLEGFHDEWQYIGTRRFVTFTNIPAGSYTLKVKASNNDGIWNEEGTSLLIIIHPPFWQTWWFRLLISFLILIAIYLTYKWRVRSIQRQNKLLEKQVEVRTAQVVQQKNEIELQKEIVEKKNLDITASIRYSKRIQDSFLPDLDDFRDHFAERFVLFRPKDIVSGDFYWIEEIEKSKSIVLSVADCTGHGVPGAMVSVLGNNGLNRCINELRLTEPNEILDNLNTFIKASLDKKDTNVRDGMDIALCSIDPAKRTLKFSGAYNPVWIARDGEIIEIKGDKQPIGKYQDSKPFTCHTFDLKSEDWVFMLSDGYPDQFGGPKGKKYKYAQLKRTLCAFTLNPQGTFSDYLAQELDTWMGDNEQVDDICIMGVKIS